MLERARGRPLEVSDTGLRAHAEAAEGGGDFVFTPPIRTDAADLAAVPVASVLRAQTNESFELPTGGGAPPVPVRTAPFAPGTLQVFGGRYSLHAVTPTSGARERLVAVLCFATRPGVRNSPAVQQMFWGRVSEEDPLADGAVGAAAYGEAGGEAG